MGFAVCVKTIDSDRPAKYGQTDLGRSFLLLVYFLYGKGQIYLTLSQMTNFSLFQTERGCRRQFQI